MHFQMSNDEKLRLLLIQQPDYEQSHATGISHGVAAVFAKWPSYIASAIWCTVFIVSLVTLLTLLIFMGLIRERKIYEQNVFIPAEEARYIVSYEIQNEFCNQMIAKHHEKRQDIPEHDLQVFDSGNNIFYLVLAPLNKYMACSVESVIRLTPEKNVFFIFLKKATNLHYEEALLQKYQNLNILNINGKKMLRGSPFEGKWKGNERSLFEVALLTVWQFGGTVMSENLLMLDRKLYDSNSMDCIIDSQFIYCPMQCASFVYYMIGETLKSQQNQSFENILDNSISSFCGSEHFIKTGCKGVSQVDETEMCNEPDNHCMFVRSQLWLKNAEMQNESLWQSFVKFCPIVKKQEIVEKHMLLTGKIRTTTKTPTTSSKHKSSTSGIPSTTVANDKKVTTENIKSTSEQTIGVEKFSSTPSIPIR